MLESKKRLFKNIALFIAITVLSASSYAANSLSFDIGDAKTINFDRNLGTVFVSNPKVLDYKIINPKKVVLLGKSNGTSTFIAYGADGKELRKEKVKVFADINELRLQIAKLFPNEDVEVSSVGVAVAVTGVASSDQKKRDIYAAITKALGKEISNDDNGYSYDGLIDNIKAINNRQINVKLTIAEVSSKVLSDIGVSFGQVNADGNIISTGEGYVQSLSNFNQKNLVAIIHAQNNNKLGQILAEPNMSVLSGETAEFHSGGKIPVITYDRDTRKIEYIDYGVSLELTAKVLRNKKIKLEINPEVSSLDEINGDSESGVPALKSRSASTTIELQNGQSFVLGGLMASDDQETVDKIPLLGDVPVLALYLEEPAPTEIKQS